MSEKETVVIARYSPVTMPLFLLLLSAMAYAFISGGRDLGQVWMTAFGYFWGLCVVGTLCLLIVWRGRAIQVRNSRLVYRLLVPRGEAFADMEDVSIEEYNVQLSFTKAIVLKKRNRSKVFIAAWLLSEDKDVIVARLRDVLGLPRAG